MTDTIAPRPGFDWSRVRWDAADQPQRNDCSYCGAMTDDDQVPLRMWDSRSNACMFCDICASRWFGFEGAP